MPDLTPDEIREGLRRLPPTPLGSSAMMGGPRQALERAAEVQGGRPENIPQTAAEIAGSTLGAAVMSPVGGLGEAGMAARGLPALGKFVVRPAIQGVGAALGGIGGGEFMHSPGETPEEASQRRISEGVAGAAGEFIAPPIQKAAGAVLRPIRNFLKLGTSREDLIEPGAAAAMRYMQPSGETLSVGQIRQSRLWDALENATEASIGGGAIGYQKRHGVAAALRGIKGSVAQWAKNVGREDAGNLLIDTIRNRASQAQRAITGGAYDAVDTAVAAAGAPKIISIQPALDRARVYNLEEAVRAGDKNAAEIMGLLNEYGKRTPIVQGPQLFDAAGNALPRTQTGGDLIPLGFSQAEKLRGALLRIARKSDQDLIPGSSALAGRIAQDLDVGIRDGMTSVGQLGVDVLDKVKIARSQSFMSHKVFDDTVGNLIGKAAPEDVAKALFKAPPSTIRRVRLILEKPEYAAAITASGKTPQQVWENLQSAYLTEMRATAGEGAEYGVLSGKKLGKALDDTRGAFTELFPNPTDRQTLRTWARALELLQSGAGGSGTGRVAMQMSQAGAIGALAGGSWAISETNVMGDYSQAAATGLRAGAGLILLGPAVISRVLTNRAFASWMLSRALSKSARVGARAGDFIAQSISHLVQANLPFTYVHPDGREEKFDPGQQGYGMQAPLGPQGESLKPKSRF